MNARQLIATSVLAISASFPAVVLAGGDATTHVFTEQSQRGQLTRQVVLNDYIQAVQAGEFNTVPGDASAIVQPGKSTTTRAEVLSMIKGANLNKGDAS
ncbi:hypothetical protein [Limnobacter parvus]|uniref:DUF4148 domain-containing protein n=1 Tax=Limnobacter parvus TaxID=2939690 RepID=A0ABT1XKA0_9BURK|nr:hypothetical protein [Limnobacter parvus]MCR2747286.1 hypothetical protein [Limnobacter parvus]